MDLIGKTLGQYEIIEQIGRGGAALVYKVYQPVGEHYLALKVLSPYQAQKANFAERFDREARIVSQLNHPNILPISDFGQDQGLSYIAMQYISGGTLKDRLRKSPLNLADVTHIITQIASALDYAHQQGILHRDIKPSNILLDENDHIYLTDFGLTKVLTDDEEDLTDTGIGLGTPTYISPEQGQGHPVDHHTDIYSLGIILYQMITGRPPFKARSPMATIFKHIHSPPRSPCKINPDLPKALDDVIFKALAKAPADRYHSATNLAHAFRQAVSDSPAKVRISHSQDAQPVTNPQKAIEKDRTPSSAKIEFTPDVVSLLPHNLPLPSTPFMGRTKELNEVISYLADSTCRILNLVGPGGIGKTRLIIQAARQLAAATPADDMADRLLYPSNVFMHGIFFVSLSPLNTVDQLIPAIANALQFVFYEDKTSDETLKKQLFNYLRTKNLLLILDNFEHLLEGVDLLTEILSQAPGIKILATSRERLNLRDEWVMEISGLDYPKNLQCQNVENYGATQLFLQSVRRIRIGYTLSENEIPYLIRICQLVEGMPLGLELASSWARLLTLKEIAQEIEQNLDFLSTSLRDIPKRHQSLRGVFEYSWNLLAPEEQAIFRKLSVFHGSFRREAAIQITGTSLHHLSALIDKSFLRRTPAGHYQIHEVLRQFAAEKLDKTPHEREDTLACYGQYYAEFLQQREKHLQEQRQHKALQEIGEEIENIRAAWNWMIEHDQTKMIGQALGSLYHFYSIRSWLQEGVETFGQAAERVQVTEGMMHEFKPEPGTIYSRILARQGRFYYRLRDYGKARELLQKSISISEYLNAPSETAFSLNSLGNVAHRLGEMEEAKQHYEESLSIYQSLGDRWGIAVSMSNLGVVIYELGGQAKHLYEESLAIFKSLGDQWGIARSLNSLGVVAYAHGEYDQAERLYKESLTLFRELRDQYGIAQSLTNLGNLAYFQRNYAEARRIHQESLIIFTDIGDQWARATSLAHLGEIAHALADDTEAKNLFQQSLSIYRELDNQQGVAATLDQLGRIAHTRKSYAEAQTLYRQSLAIYQKLGNHWGTVDVLNDLGQVACSLADYSAAKQYFAQALQSAKAVNVLPQILNSLIGVATLLTHTADKEQAVILLAILEDNLKDDKETADQAERLLTTLIADLPTEVFMTAWQQGQTQTIESAVETILAWDLTPMVI